MAGETEVVNEIPQAQPRQTTLSFAPVRFDMALIWSSPATWVLVGALGTLVALYFLKKYER